MPLHIPVGAGNANTLGHRRNFLPLLRYGPKIKGSERFARSSIRKNTEHGHRSYFRSFRVLVTHPVPGDHRKSDGGNVRLMVAKQNRFPESPFSSTLTLLSVQQEE